MLFIIPCQQQCGYPAPMWIGFYITKVGSPFRISVRRLWWTRFQINYLILHTRPDMEYRPQRTGPPRIPEHERNASSLSSESENYHIFLQGQSKTLSLYVMGRANAIPECKYTELNRITVVFLSFCNFVLFVFHNTPITNK